MEEGPRERRELQRRIRELEAEKVRSRELSPVDPFGDPDKVALFAAMAQAKGVCLSVAQRPASDPIRLSKRPSRSKPHVNTRRVAWSSSLPKAN